MAKNFIQNGDTIDFVATADVKSSELVVVGAMVAVALANIASGEIGVGKTTGVFSLPKASGAISQGATVYVKDGAVTTTPTDAVYAGKAWASAASADATIDVSINFGNA